MTVTPALVLAFGAVLSPLAVLGSQWITRSGQARFQAAEHAEARRVREREFQEQRRERLHGARIEAHATLISLCDERLQVRTSTDDANGTQAQELLRKALQQAATVGVYSSPPVAALAEALVWHVEHFSDASQFGHAQFGDPEDPTILGPTEAWQALSKGRADYVAAFQTELGIEPPTSPTK